MPAVLEIEETPASPIGRAIIWVIVLLFIVTVAWGFFGKMDVVAVAPGKIIPSGRVKTIQPLEIGKVKIIHVKDGQMVKQGDALITLDSTATQADTDRLKQQLYSFELQRIRQQHYQNALSQNDMPRQWQEHALTALESAQASQLLLDPNDQEQTLSNKQAVTTQYQLLLEEINEYQFRKETLNNELVKRKAEGRRTSATVTKLMRTLPLITERVGSLEKLMKRDLVARDQYLSLEQGRIEQEQDLLALKAQHQELNASINEIKAQIKTLKAEAQKNNLIEQNETNQQLTALKQELIKAKQRNQQQLIKSPINGTVQQLAVHTIGGVVTPAQELMLVVPKESILEVEALILNKDIGFVEEGQIAEVKIDTFNFTKYGTIDAEITNISNDAISDENLGLVYMTKVLIKKTQMEINKKLVNLSPGMSVSVEIKTGKRRIIEYFLSPLLRYKQESIRER